MKQLFCSLALGAMGLALSTTAIVAQTRGGTLVQITQPEPPNLAPFISTSTPIAQVTSKVFDGLLEYDFDLKPQPSLPKAGKSPKQVPAFARLNHRSRSWASTHQPCRPQMLKTFAQCRAADAEPFQQRFFRRSTSSLRTLVNAFRLDDGAASLAA
nr:hypothetical protein [Paracoccus sp. EF6]